MGLNFAVLRLKMCQCMHTSIRNAIPSWKFSACDRSWSLIGRTTAPRKISLKARFPIKTFVTLLIFLFLMTMKITIKLLTTAKIRISTIQTRKMPASKVKPMVYRVSSEQYTSRCWLWLLSLDLPVADLFKDLLGGNPIDIFRTEGYHEWVSVR